MKKRDIVLAVAVLSVLAGLLTVGYAQNPDDGPDAFELRRQAIDRIEAAFTAGDVATLQRFTVPPDVSKKVGEELQRLSDYIDKVLADPDKMDDELQSVTSEFQLGAYMLGRYCEYQESSRLEACDLEHDLCLGTPASCGGHGSTIAECFDVDAITECSIATSLCKLEVYENPPFLC